MRCSAIVLLCLFLFSAEFINGFVCNTSQIRLAPFKVRIEEFRPLFASREEEIADLEEKLRRLKEEESMLDTSYATSTYGREMDDSTSLQPMTSSNEMDEPFEEMLSEKWKEYDPSQDESSSSGNIAKVAGTLAVLAGLIIFSQVPVGQEDLNKYSTAKPSATIDLGDLNPVKMNSI
mmetsp:Transcript_2737/g.3888  ORF Transcript_2737/g.3888 Transcript_2737/m.3888 type:complete len:177 (+) Transcript_2737:92-622(+)